MTRKLLPLLIGAVAIAAGPAHARERISPEAELARALEGRVAGEPVNCIDLRRVRSSQMIERTALLYEIGNVVYVNRPRSGAESLDEWSTQIARPFASRLCRIDPIQMVDPASGMLDGIVFLGEFVPYRRVGDRD